MSQHQQGKTVRSKKEKYLPIESGVKRNSLLSIIHQND